MSKAEEYIKAYTRGCSNVLVYGGYHEWPTPENALAAVELAREEMREQMMKDAIDARILSIGQNAIVREENEDVLRKYLLSKFQNGDKVKVIIIRE